MKILIFEDEIYNFHLLRHTLEEINPEYDVIGPIPSVEQGREYLSLHHDISLKPIGDGCLAEAMRKAHLLIAARERSLKEEEGRIKKMQHNGYRERFVVKSFNGERTISLSTIQYIVSEHKSTYLVLLDGTSCPIDMSLEVVAGQLDPMKFMRVNRKYIVPAELVSGMERLVNGKELLKLKTKQSPEIIISRTRKVQVRKWLDR